MEKKISDLKVAIVHDWFWSMKGAEKVAEALGEVFPQADIYSLFGDWERMSESLRKHKVTFSILQELPFIRELYRYTYFLWPLVIEEFNFKDYDLVISSSSSIAKGVLVDYKTMHICYMHSPMRYAWDQTHEYFNSDNFSLIKRFVIHPLLNYLRIWDVTATERIDILVVNSKFTASRVMKYYRRGVDAIIYPPVDVGQGKSSRKRKNYYVATPFDPNKGGRLIVDAAKRYGFNLKLYGTGPLFKELRRKARGYKNIELLGWISDRKRWKLLSESKGYICAGVEDFGIISLEANACGVPAIAYKSGGVAESIINGKTGVFFTDRTTSSLYEAILRRESTKFKTSVMKKHAKKFGKERFIREISGLVERSI